MKTLAVGVVTLFVVAAACNRPEGLGVSTTTTTGAVILPADTAIDTVTTTRCSRELACNRAGVGPYFANDDECIVERSRDTRQMLSPEKCPEGLRDNALETCVRDIKNVPCVERLDTIERVMSCRSSKMCR